MNLQESNALRWCCVMHLQGMPITFTDGPLPGIDKALVKMHFLDFMRRMQCYLSTCPKCRSIN